LLTNKNGQPHRFAILHSHLGSGHSRAAQALADALRANDPGCRIELIDFWSLMAPRVAAMLKGGYLTLVSRDPDAYQRLYRLTADTWKRYFRGGRLPPPLPEIIEEALAEYFPEVTGRLPVFRRNLDEAVFTLLMVSLSSRRSLSGVNLLRWGLVLWLRSILIRRLGQRLGKLKPDAIAITQLFPANLMLGLRARGKYLDVPTVAIATDHGLHDLWVRSKVDYYCVPQPEMKEALVSRGFQPARVFLTGIPLPEGFEHPPACKEARRILGLDPSRPVLLVTGGSYGIGVSDTLKRLLEADDQWQLIATAAGDSEVAMSFDGIRRRYGDRVRLYEWSDEMPTLMSAADIVIGKPGGMTVTECLACGRPFLAICSLGGQEHFNTDLLARYDVGGLIRPEALVSTLRAWLADPDDLAIRKARAAVLGQPRAAERVALILEGLTGAGDVDAIQEKIA
jgi:processive 1,2-diacylglycerol beta-glucosyltransferase